MAETAILWLRRDLRLNDNPALQSAMTSCERVLPLYIHAPGEEAPWAPGGASRWWLHHSLESLDWSLRERGSRLAIVKGETLKTLLDVASVTGATRVLWSRLYDPATRERDTRVKAALRAKGLCCESHNSLLLREPWEVQTGAQEPYRVFSAFWRKFPLEDDGTSAPEAPGRFPPTPDLEGNELSTLALLPRIHWARGLVERWRPGEAAAQARAHDFVGGSLASYGKQRDLPALAGTSSLSPHLHFGEISPRHLLALIAARHGNIKSSGAEPYVRELVWREFAHHLLYHFPATPEEPLDHRFSHFPWRVERADALLAAWQHGRTGVPFVDAGMRELWQTGWMHNRARMVAASFLTKNLRLSWRAGASWFWDTLVDADLASNTMGWQWTAGCGADAAPYFRIFNPVRQGERFDAQGAYVKRWCPELNGLPAEYVHQPWNAPTNVLHAAGLALGNDYPNPIVDLTKSRQEALAAYERIKAG